MCFALFPAFFSQCYLNNILFSGHFSFLQKLLAFEFLAQGLLLGKLKVIIFLHMLSHSTLYMFSLCFLEDFVVEHLLLFIWFATSSGLWDAPVKGSLLFVFIFSCSWADFTHDGPSINSWLLKQRLSFVLSNSLIILFSPLVPLGS